MLERATCHRQDEPRDELVLLARVRLEPHVLAERVAEPRRGDHMWTIARYLMRPSPRARAPSALFARRERPALPANALSASAVTAKSAQTSAVPR
jgi:hypothetical protein